MKKKGQGVEYIRVADHYFEKRGLRRYAGVWSLWALGVGAVISGDFFGWNFGLAAGGFGGLLIATLIITVMYAGLCFSIAEMTAALPHTGGAYSFARSAMGPWGAYITGLAENMEYILTPAVIVVGIGGYLGAIFGTPASVEPLWWLGAYAVFVGLNVAGVETTFRFTVLITGSGPGGARPVLGHGDSSLRYEMGAQHRARARPDPMASPGSSGDPVGAPVCDLVFPSDRAASAGWRGGTHPGTRSTARPALRLADPRRGGLPDPLPERRHRTGRRSAGLSAEPLFEGFKTIFGAGLGAKLLALVAVTGLIASFHSIIFAYGRQIFSLSRAGYFPRWLSRTHPRRQTPHVALFVGALLGYLVATAFTRSAPSIQSARSYSTWRSSARSSPTRFRCCRTSCCAFGYRTSIDLTEARSACPAP